MHEAADRISSGALTENITFQDRADEINSLIHSVNHMQEKIRSCIQGLQDVTNNIAHDLHSPATRMRGLVESILLEHSGELQIVSDESTGTQVFISLAVGGKSE